MTQKQNTLQLHCSKKEFQHLPSHYMLIYNCALKKKEILILNGCSVFTPKHFVLNYINIIGFYASFLLYIALIYIHSFFFYSILMFLGKFIEDNTYKIDASLRKKKS